jgi:hypothetical protein
MGSRVRGNDGVVGSAFAGMTVRSVPAFLGANAGTYCSLVQLLWLI